MSDERRLILEMLRDGRLTVEEAEALLDALGEPGESPPNEPWTQLERGLRQAVEGVGPALRSALDAWRRHVGGGPDARGAAQEDRMSYPAPAGRLVIRNLRGDLTVEDSPDGSVHIEVHKRVWASSEATAEEFVRDVRTVVEPRDGDLVVEVVPPPSGRFAADLTVRVPARVGLQAQVVSGDVRVGEVASCELRVGSGDVEVRGASGVLAVRVGSGDVRVGVAEGDLSVDVGRGDVSAGRVQGSARVRVGSGDASLGPCSGRVDVQVQRGDLDLRVDGAPSVRAEVASGDVRLELVSLPAGAHAEVHVAAGDVELVVGPRLRARIEARTQRGTVTWTATAQGLSCAPDRAEGVVGGPDSAVSVRVASGDVVVREGR